MAQQRNLFSDRSSLVLRNLLAHSGREWVVRDFLDKKISLGQANKTLNRAEELGFVVRVRRGRNSFARLKSREALLKDWAKFYNFNQNPQIALFDQGDRTLAKISKYFKKQGIRYALTAFSASRLISPYVLNRNHYLYVDVKPEQLPDLSRRLQDHLGFLKLAKGGNTWIAAPYYRAAVFDEGRRIAGHPVVSDLQIYLDLIGLAAGQDEVQHLKETYKKRGGRFV